MYSNELILKILKYIEDNIHRKITIDEIAKKFYFNKDYIMRLFKKELGLTILDYINRKRVYNSLIELKETNDLMTKVAFNNGFFSQEYFCEVFNKVIGVNPLLYRKFTKIHNNLTNEELSLIRTNLTILIDIIAKIEKYKRNLPSSEIKVLSLFK